MAVVGSDKDGRQRMTEQREHSADAARALPLGGDMGEDSALLLAASPPRGNSGEIIEPGRALALADFAPPSVKMGERLIRLAYRIGVSGPGFYTERLNTDAGCYGGGNIGNGGGVAAEPLP